MTGRCRYCGNNPVPHLLHWFYESLDLWLGPLRRLLLFNPVSVLLSAALKKTGLSYRLVGLLVFVGLLVKQRDPQRCRVRRAQVLWQEAERQGIAMVELRLVFGGSLDVYFASWHGKKMVFSGLPRPAGSGGSNLDQLDDKLLFKGRLAAAGLPVPPGDAASNLRQARKIFSGLRPPVIVKPRSGSRGRHTTTYVYDQAQLDKAFFLAKQLCHWAVIEEQLPGPVFRATVIAGRLAGVLRGDPPEVVGDGLRSIAELVIKKNRERDSRVAPVEPGIQVAEFLSRQGLELSSVPAAGQAVKLSEKIGLGYGGSSSEDYEICHPDNRELFLRAAAAARDPLLGFDFIIPDIAQSYLLQRCGFIEANTLPFINLHHDPLLGRPRNAAAMLWQALGWGGDLGKDL